MGINAVFKWHKWFAQGGDSVEDDEHSGSSMAARTKPKMQEVAMLVRSNHSETVVGVAVAGVQFVVKCLEVWLAVASPQRPCTSLSACPRVAGQTAGHRLAPYSLHLAPCRLFVYSSFPAWKNIYVGVGFRRQRRPTLPQGKPYGTFLTKSFTVVFQMFCVASVTKTSRLQGVQTVHR
jgi:hypothetical protein